MSLAACHFGRPMKPPGLAWEIAMAEAGGFRRLTVCGIGFVRSRTVAGARDARTGRRPCRRRGRRWPARRGDRPDAGRAGRHRDHGRRGVLPSGDLPDRPGQTGRPPFRRRSRPAGPDGRSRRRFERRFSPDLIGASRGATPPAHDHAPPPDLIRSTPTTEKGHGRIEIRAAQCRSGLPHQTDPRRRRHGRPRGRGPPARAGRPRRAARPVAAIAGSSGSARTGGAASPARKPKPRPMRHKPRRHGGPPIRAVRHRRRSG